MGTTEDNNRISQNSAAAILGGTETGKGLEH